MTHLLFSIYLAGLLSTFSLQPSVQEPINRKIEAHPFYVSICQIDYNGDNQSLEISLKIFIDDIEEIMEKEGVGRLYLGEKRENKESDKYISRYLAQQFKIKVDGQEKALEYLGKETEVDAIWCYLEGLSVSPFSSVEIRNSILMDHIESQVNIVHVKQAGIEKSLIFNKDKRSGTLEFN
ncbi:MAG: DUF6702 family protein [Bacteroidota bacterium]